MQTDGYTDKWAGDIQTEGQTDIQTDRQTNMQTDGYKDEGT